MQSKQKFFALALGVAALNMGSLAKNANACYLDTKGAHGTDCDQVAQGYGSLQQSITVSAPDPLAMQAESNLLARNVSNPIAINSNIASNFASLMQPVPHSGSTFVDNVLKSQYGTLPGPMVGVAIAPFRQAAVEAIASGMVSRPLLSNAELYRKALAASGTAGSAEVVCDEIGYLLNAGAVSAKTVLRGVIARMGGTPWDQPVKDTVAAILAGLSAVGVTVVP